jgi:hypothetical protein
MTRCHIRDELDKTTWSSLGHSWPNGSPGLSCVYGEVILHLPMVSCIKASLHHVGEFKLKDILVV